MKTSHCPIKLWSRTRQPSNPESCLWDISNLLFPQQDYHPPHRGPKFFLQHLPSSLLPSNNMETLAKQPDIDTYLFDNHHERLQQLYRYLVFTSVAGFVFVAGILVNLVVMFSLMIWVRPLEPPTEARCLKFCKGGAWGRFWGMHLRVWCLSIRTPAGLGACGDGMTISRTDSTLDNEFLDFWTAPHHFMVGSTSPCSPGLWEHHELWATNDSEAWITTRRDREYIFK